MEQETCILDKHFVCKFCLSWWLLCFATPPTFFWPKKIAQREDKEINNIIKNKFISVKLAAGQKEMDLKGK